jgi:plastocyanin
VTNGVISRDRRGEMFSCLASYASMKLIPRDWFGALAALTLLLNAGCGGETPRPMPVEPTPVGPLPTVVASAYILPNAVSLNDHAFGDEPIVVYKNERLRWVNVDGLTHQVVADSPDATDFRTTGDLAPGSERSFTMIRLGTTGIHCANHPNMTGTLIVRER